MESGYKGRINNQKIKEKVLRIGKKERRTLTEKIDQ